MNYRQHTAWKKSRKFGDVFGGRTAPKLADNIFKRCHSLKRPTADQVTPIFIEENPSRDFFFPVTRQEILATFKRLPKEHTAGITHIWLRRINKAEYEAGETNFAEFTCGSGVRLITLYPWPIDLVLRFGAIRPPVRFLRELHKYTSQLENRGGKWTLRWTLESLREFYLE